jgi:hypothetical protein
LDWAAQSVLLRPEGDYVQNSHLEGNEIHSRVLWRIPGLRHSTYPGIKEAVMIEKTNLTTFETDRQYFITSQSPKTWSASEILARILLHWDTETGVFGIKDNTFQEDKVRYFSLAGALSHVSLLNMAWNCLSATVFQRYWEGDSLRCRMRFWQDNPAFNPFT